MKTKQERAKEYFQIGVSFENSGELEKALEIHEKVIELDAEYASAYSAIASVLFKLDRDPEAQLYAATAYNLTK